VTPFSKAVLFATLTTIIGSAAFMPVAHAEEAAATAPAPLTANVTVASEYRYRGLSQSNFQPAIQVGIDYAHESGFYLGNWNSNISWISDENKGTSAPIEIDIYGGYKHDWSEGFIADIGVLQYYYPTSGYPSSSVNPNTTEIYVAQNFTFGPVTGFAKVSYAVTPLFGTSNSTGSTYSDLTINYDTGVWGLALNGHVGYQYLAGSNAAGGSNNSLYSYTDWKLGVTKDFGDGFSAHVSYIGTNASITAYASPSGTNLGRGAALFEFTKTF